MTDESSILSLESHDTSGNVIGCVAANERTSLLRAVERALVAAAHSTTSGQARSTSSGQARTKVFGSLRLMSAPADIEAYRANGLEAVDRHLDRFLAALRQPGEPQITQVLDGTCDSCEGCPQSSMVCPLCAFGTCIVLRDAETILLALAEALWAVKDPQYVQNHPNGPQMS